MKTTEKRGLFALAVFALLPALVCGHDYAASGKEPESSPTPSSILARPLAQESDDEEPPFRGIGLRFKVFAGWNHFAGGDIEKGSRGIFDQAAALVTSLGYTIERGEEKAFTSGYGLGGEIAYFFTPRLGIGLRFGRVRATGRREFQYIVDNTNYGTSSQPEVKTNSLLLGLQYRLPLHRYLTLSLNAGPEFYWVHYVYVLNVITPQFREATSHDARGTRLGGQAGLGIEIHLNERVALVMEVQGRAARISKIKGLGRYYRLENSIPTQREEHGYLYYDDGGAYPQLFIAEVVPAVTTVRHAVFDFTGVALNGGLIFRF